MKMSAGTQIFLKASRQESASHTHTGVSKGAPVLGAIVLHRDAAEGGGQVLQHVEAEQGGEVDHVHERRDDATEQLHNNAVSSVFIAGPKTSIFTTRRRMQTRRDASGV